MTITDRLRSIARAFLRVDAAPEPREDITYAMPGTWQNTLTGQGNEDHDRLTAHVPISITPLSTQQLSVLYLQDPIAGRVCSARVDDAMRQGFGLGYGGGASSDEDLIPDLETRLEELGARAAIRQAAKWGQTYGWGGVLVLTNQTNLEAPLVREQVSEVKSFIVLDRRDVSVNTWSAAGKPLTYRVNLSIPGIIALNSIVHESHILRFGGRDTSVRDAVQYFDGFDCPVLQPVWETIRGFNSGWYGAISALIDASVGIFKLPSLAKLLGMGGRETLINRLSAMKTSLWMGRWLPIDATESLEYVTRSFAGIPDLLSEQKSLVAAAAEMPMTRLFGQSPAGLNATGVSDEKAWHSQVESFRTSNLDPPTRALLELVARTLGSAEPEQFYPLWPQLEVLNALEQAQLEFSVGQADAARVALGMTEETILKHRYGGSEPNWTAPLLDNTELAALETVTSIAPMPVETSMTEPPSWSGMPTPEVVE